MMWTERFFGRGFDSRHLHHLHSWKYAQPIGGVENTNLEREPIPESAADGDAQVSTGSGVRERTAREMTDVIGMTTVNANDDSFAPMAIAA